MTTTPTNTRPLTEGTIDPTGPITRGSRPADELGPMYDAIEAGRLPAGFWPDDEPAEDGRRTYVGEPHSVRGASACAYSVVSVDPDGQVLGGVVRIEVGHGGRDAEHDLTMREARAFACAVTAAADDLLAANPTRPLDVISTARIWDEIARRISGPRALREAIAAADPAALTREDRDALAELLARAGDAAEGA